MDSGDIALTILGLFILFGIVGGVLALILKSNGDNPFR